MTDVILQGVSKSFGKTLAIDDVSLSVHDGSFVVLLGPTGAGKTTTLRLVAGLEKPESGSIKIGPHDVTELTPAQRNVAMVFQQYSLYPHFTVRQNLEFPLKSPLLRTPKATVKERVDEVAEVLKISHKLDNKATELSGGEMQRVSIGRALVRKPDVFLMDEPLSSLDAKLRSELRLELKRLQSELGATMLYVTHDQIEAMTMATHVGVLNEGVLVQFGSPREIYQNPSTLYVATRLGLPRINTLPADLFGQAPSGAVSIGLRPENILLAQSSQSGQHAGDSQTHTQPVAGTVTRVEALGDQTRLHIDLSGHALITLIDPVQLNEFEPGREIAVTPTSPLFFNHDGNRVHGV